MLLVYLMVESGFSIVVQKLSCRSLGFARFALSAFGT